VELPAGALLAAGIGPGARLRRDDIPATSGKPVPRGG
jgi:peptidyl-tRNA hydrolase